VDELAMGYARLPDTFPFAGTTVAAGNAAIGALVRMMAWSAGDGTDGFVPTAMAKMIAKRGEIPPHCTERALRARVAAWRAERSLLKRGL
jgi:hypothetical protein